MTKLNFKPLFADNGAHFARARDVANGLSTPLGEFENWPASLKSVFSILLSSGCPLFLVWDCISESGNRVLLYNEACLSLLNEAQDSSSSDFEVSDRWNQNWPTIQADIDQVFTTGQPLQSHKNLCLTERDFDRNTCGYTWSYSPIWDEAGHIKGVFATGYQTATRDALAIASNSAQTASELQSSRATLQQAEAALMESEARFSAFMSHSPTAAWIADQEGRLLYLSPTYFQMFHFPHRDAVGKQINDIYSREFAQQFIDNNRRVFQTGQGVETVEAAPRPDGSIGSFLVYKFPIVQSPDEILLGGVAIDITEHKHTEEILRQREEELRLITNALPVLIAYVDKDHYYRFNNQTYEVWFGQPVDHYTGKHVRDVLGTDAYNAVLPYMERALLGQLVSYESQVPYRTGGIRYIQADYIPHINSQGEVKGYFSLVSDISERKRVENERKHAEAARRQTEHYLRESEERFRFVTKAVSGLIFDWDLQTNNVYRSEKLYDLVGIYPEQAPPHAMWWHDRVHPDDSARLQHQIAEMLASPGEIYDAEYRVRHEKGHWVDVWEQACLVRNEQGNVIRIVGCTVDISDRKKIEDELRTSEERLRFAVEGAALGTWEYDLTSSQIICSAQAKRMFGVPPDATVDYKIFINQVHPDDRERVNAAVEGAIAQHQIYDVEMRSVWLDGSVHWIRSIGRAQYNDLGVPTRMIGVALDITDRKHTEEALRQGEERLRLAMEGAQMGTWDVDLRSGKAIWSDYHFTMLGYDSNPTGEASETLWYDRIHLDDRERVSQEWQQSRHEKRLYRVEYRVIRADNGQVAWLGALGSFTYDQNNEPVRSTGVLFDISDRKQAEIALVAQEQRYRYIFEAINVSIWEEDFTQVKAAINHLKAAGVQDFRQYFADHPEFVEQAIGMVVLRDVNQASLELFGAQTKAELLNSLHQIFMPETQDAFTLELIAIATEEPYFAAETVLRNLQGKELQVWFTITFPPLSEPFDRVLVSILDISDRKQTENALRYSEGQLRLAQRAARAGLWDWDILLNKVTWSDEYYQLYGLDPSITPCYENWIESIWLPDRDRVEQITRDALEHCTNLNVEFRVLHPTKGICWLTAIGQTFYNAEGQPIRMTGIALDITARKRAELEQEQHLAREQSANKTLQRFIEHTPVSVVMLDRDMRYLFASQRWMQEYAPGYADLTGLSHYDVMSDLPEHWREVHQRCLAGATEQCKEDYYLRADGSAFWLHWEVLPWYDSEGEIGGIIIFAENITERKLAAQERDTLLAREQKARQDAEQANRIKDEFLAVLSHELRSPLNPILGWAKLLQVRQFNSSETLRALETIERNAKLQVQLIDDLLDVSRILRGKMMLTVSDVDLAAVIDAAIETVRLSAEAKKISLQKTVADDIGSISGDFGRLQQIVWNLLSNAIKFTPLGGQIEVKLSRVDCDGSVLQEQTTHTQGQIENDPKQIAHYAQIEVCDTGKGISPEFLPYVFDYFRQEDGTTTRKFGGLGLGLAIVRYLTDQHGGMVKADSPGERLGSTFTVLLPISTRNTSETPHALEAAGTGADPFPLANVRILIVDDEADMRELMFTILEHTGAETRIVSSAAEALDVLAAFKPDLLISDIGMPEVDGYALMRHVQTLPPDLGGQIPAIALTAYAGELDQQQALTAGFLQHLAKPIEPNALVSAIKALIRL